MPNEAPSAGLEVDDCHVYRHRGVGVHQTRDGSGNLLPFVVLRGLAEAGEADEDVVVRLDFATVQNSAEAVRKKIDELLDIPQGRG